MTIRATNFRTAHEAIQWADASGRGVAVTVEGHSLVTSRADADRLATAGVEFAYLCGHRGQIVTVPVN